MTADIIAAARFLATQIEYSRHQPWVDEFFTAIDKAAGKVRFVVNGPNEQKYLGPCGYIETPEECSRYGIGDHDCAQHEACEGDIYAPRGAQRGRCRDCGAEVSTGDREAWLDGEVRSHAFRAAEIAEAYGVSENTIRTWSTRPRADTGEPALKSYYRTDAGIVADWAEPPEGVKRVRLHYVGDVLDLAAADAARREGERAKRARRAAARAAETEDAA